MVLKINYLLQEKILIYFHGAIIEDKILIFCISASIFITVLRLTKYLEFFGQILLPLKDKTKVFEVLICSNYREFGQIFIKFVHTKGILRDIFEIYQIR